MGDVTAVVYSWKRNDREGAVGVRNGALKVRRDSYSGDNAAACGFEGARGTRDARVEHMGVCVSIGGSARGNGDGFARRIGARVAP